MCRNKYYGLKLCEEGFKEELVTFLHNGQQFRTELIEPLLHKLRKLYKVIDKQHSFRFYSSSLLLMYEGHVENCDEMSNSCCCCLKEQEHGRSKQEQLSRNNSSTHLNKHCQCHSHRCKVDVRMIDFAHTTHSGFSGDRTRTGPDTGYLFGLKNLIRLLEEIQDKYHESSDAPEEVILKSDKSQVN